MTHLKNIKGIIFDYGSALDVSGRNWLHPIHQAYTSMGIEISKDIVRQGMIQTAVETKDQRDGSSPYYYSLKDFFTSKARRAILWITQNHPLVLGDVSEEELSITIARGCYQYSHRNAIAVGNILRELAKKYRLALVSNFNGNLESVLEDFQLKHHFAVVTTYAQSPVPKTTQELFAETIRNMGMLPRDVLVVGDSISRDIVPATTLGCHTAWLQNILNPDYTTNLPVVLPKSTIRLKSLTELKKIVGV